MAITYQCALIVFRGSLFWCLQRWVWTMHQFHPKYEVLFQWDILQWKATVCFAQTENRSGIINGLEDFAPCLEHHPLLFALQLWVKTGLKPKPWKQIGRQYSGLLWLLVILPEINLLLWAKSSPPPSVLPSFQGILWYFFPSNIIPLSRAENVPVERGGGASAELRSCCWNPAGTAQREWFEKSGLASEAIRV